MKKISKILQTINESRSTRLLEIVDQLKKLDMFDQLINSHYLPDGITALIRDKSGNAYEFQIRPAERAEYHDEFTKNDDKRKIAADKKKKWDAMSPEEQEADRRLAFFGQNT